jgi:hypothetical protein
MQVPSRRTPMHRLLGAFPGSHARLNNATDLPQLRAGSASQGLVFQSERCSQEVNRPVDPNNPPQPRQDYVEISKFTAPLRPPLSQFHNRRRIPQPWSAPTRACRAVQPELTLKSKASAISAIVADGLRYPPRCGANAHRLRCHRICGQEQEECLDSYTTARSRCLIWQREPTSINSPGKAQQLGYCRLMKNDNAKEVLHLRVQATIMHHLLSISSRSARRRLLLSLLPSSYSQLFSSGSRVDCFNILVANHLHRDENKERTYVKKRGAWLCSFFLTFPSHLQIFGLIGCARIDWTLRISRLCVHYL